MSAIETVKAVDEIVYWTSPVVAAFVVGLGLILRELLLSGKDIYINAKNNEAKKEEEVTRQKNELVKQFLSVADELAVAIIQARTSKDDLNEYLSSKSFEKYGKPYLEEETISMLNVPFELGHLVRETIKDASSRRDWHAEKLNNCIQKRIEADQIVNKISVFEPKVRTACLDYLIVVQLQGLWYDGEKRKPSHEFMTKDDRNEYKDTKYHKMTKRKLQKEELRLRNEISKFMI